ncbi:MAG: hypothetical protein EA379_00465 [Phycisphaerales bacterium]|nr:MAG: hypothetical protein EA379_00465 [Phycisphaerales bacterium]
MSLVVRGERFETRETLPGWQLLRLASDMRSEDAMRQMAGMHDFILALLAPHERPRFERFMADADAPLEEVEQVVGALMAEYSDRPTERPSGSPAGPPSTGPRSRVVSFSRGTVETAETSSTAGQATGS